MTSLQDIVPMERFSAAWLSVDRWPDPLSMETFARDILRLSGARSGEERAVTVYRWLNRVFRWGPPYHEWSSLGWVNCDDLVKILAVHGCHYCDGWGRLSSALWNAGAMGAPVEKLVVWVPSGIPGHTMSEFIYEDADGVERGHAFDIFHQVSSRTRDGARFASFEEVLMEDRSLWKEPTDPLQPWYYRPSQREAEHNTRYTAPSHGLLVPPEHDLRHRIRPGTAITRYYDPRFEPYLARVEEMTPKPAPCRMLHDPEPACNADGSPRDPANEPFFRAYLKKCETPGCPSNGQLVRFYASGEHVVRPPLSSTAALQASSSHTLLHARAEDARLLEATPKQLACYILPVECPYILTGAELSFSFVKNDPEDWVAVQASPDGGLRVANLWTAPKEKTAGPRKVVVKLGLDEFLAQKPSVYGRYRIYFRFELLSHGDAGSCWFEDVEFRGRFMHNGMVSPMLMPGRNRFALTGASALAPVALRLEWEEKDGPKSFSAAANSELLTENIHCEGREPADVRMAAVSLSAG